MRWPEYVRGKPFSQLAALPDHQTEPVRVALKRASHSWPMPRLLRLRLTILTSSTRCALTVSCSTQKSVGASDLDPSPSFHVSPLSSRLGANDKLHLQNQPGRATSSPAIPTHLRPTYPSRPNGRICQPNSPWGYTGYQPQLKAASTLSHQCGSNRPSWI